MSDRLSLKMTREMTEENLKFNVQTAQRKLQEELGDITELVHYYIYVSSSDHSQLGCTQFSLHNIDGAVSFFKEKAQLTTKRLYVALGIDYEIGAEDLLITGTDYGQVD